MNSSQKFTEKEEKLYFDILFNYKKEIELNKIFYINEFFIKGILHNKFSYNFIINYLKEKSWLGKSIPKQKGDKKINFKWIDLIAPALFNYFHEMNIYVSNPSLSSPNFVLCIDSLVLKIEGILRDMFYLSGEPTFYFKEDNKGRNIEREKDITALLYEDKIIELFDEDDLLFFRFLLIEQAGYNLRHRVAHSLLLFEEYNISKMNLLIIALLKLGKYDFQEK